MTVKRYPPDPVADARNRAWRTTVQALIAVAVIGAASAVVPLMAGDQPWTSGYWAGVGKTAATGAVMAVLAYVGRLKTPPPL